MRCIEPDESDPVDALRPARGVSSPPWSAALLLGALSAALLAQGAYYPRAQCWVAVLRRGER